MGARGTCFIALEDGNQDASPESACAPITAKLRTYLDVSTFTLLTTKSGLLVWLSDRRAARHGGLWQLGGNTASCIRGRAYTLYTSGSGTKSERKKKWAAAENRTGLGFSYDVEYAYRP